MSETKRIFVAFAKEDESQRDLLRGQSRLGDSPIEYVDFSVKEPYDTAWRERVRTRIRGVDGVIALVSKSTPSAAGELWEITCAREERVPMIGLYAYTNDRTYVSQLTGYKVIPWTWDGIAAFINGL